MHIIFGPRKVIRQIEEYSRWKCLRFPGAAFSHKRELLDFVKKSRVCCVEEITPQKVKTYLYTINSIAMRSIAMRALTSFFRYCRMMGYADIRFTAYHDLSTLEEMTVIHPLLRVDKVRRAKELRGKFINGKPMSYRAIKAKMENEDKCVYDVHAIYRWVNYKLPGLSTA
jgi:hypothetical protein